MTDTFIMLENRNPRIFCDCPDKPFSASRDYKVDNSLELEHFHNRLTFRDINKRNSAFVESFFLYNISQNVHNRLVRVNSLVPSSEYYSIASLQTKACRIDCYIRSGLIDDSYDSDGHAHLPNSNSIRSFH